MSVLPPELAGLLSPVIGAGAVLYFMRRDRAALDERLDEIRREQRESAEEAGKRLGRIEGNQHRLELNLKDTATRDQLLGMDARVDGVDRRLAVLEEKCRVGLTPHTPGPRGGHA